MQVAVLSKYSEIKNLILSFDICGWTYFRMTFSVFIKHEDRLLEPSYQMDQFSPLESGGKCGNCSEVINIWHEAMSVLLWRK